MASPDDVFVQFNRRERAAWQRLARGYDTHFKGLVMQMLDPLLAAAQVRSGGRVLDLCCGPGYVAARALARGALPIGVDASARMLAIARRNHPDIAFRAGDAEHLEFADCSFDAVIMNLGLHHIGRPERALAEAARVLRPGGRLVFTVWAAPCESVAHRLIFDAVNAHGRLDAVPPGPSMFRFSDAGECRRVASQAGLDAVATSTLPLVWDLPAPDGLLAAAQAGGVRLAMLLEAQTPTSLHTIKAVVRKASEPYACNGGLRLPIAAALTSARRPRAGGAIARSACAR
jgi:ubiquinone/menaquinone biosynthesis C-methylase UbiE